MPGQPNFDVNAAHRYFAANCFNHAWDFIDRPQRSPAEEDEMLLLAMASLWHWQQRPEATPTNLSVGYWQVSRVFALRGDAANARRYAALSLQTIQSAGAEPFHLGYAYEAMARAEMVAGSAEKAAEYLLQARTEAEKVEEAEDRALLLKDLDSIQAE